MFYFIVAVSLVLFATLLETLILAGSDWKTSDYTPAYKLMVGSGIKSFCGAFWNVLLMYAIVIVLFTLVGSYFYGWYNIFIGVSSKFVNLTVALSIVLCAVLIIATVIIVITKIIKLFNDNSEDAPKPVKIVTAIKNIYSKIKDKYCPTLK